jgi:hypothetical protein
MAMCWGAQPAYELKIHAVRKFVGGIPSRSSVQRQLIEVVREAHRMGIANIRSYRLELELR